MPASKSATVTSKPRGRSRATTALRKATSAVSKASSSGGKKVSKKATKKSVAASARHTTKKAAKTPTPARKAAAKKVAAKAPAKKAPAKKTAAKKQAAKKTGAARQAPAKKIAKKASSAKSAVKSTSSTSTAKKTAKTTKAAPVKQTAPTKKAAPAKTGAATKAPTKKSAATKAPAKKPTINARKLKVRDDESPWTAKELAAVRAELENDVQRLSHELSGFEDDIAVLIKDSGDGAGDDQADAGAKTFEREHEYSLAQNSRDLLEQSVHALERMEDGTYGVCENCGNAIGKLRLQAFPRATLCLNCKAQQERR